MFYIQIDHIDRDYGYNNHENVNDYIHPSYKEYEHQDQKKDNTHNKTEIINIRDQPLHLAISLGVLLVILLIQRVFGVHKGWLDG
jgi:hypothetical protein